MTPNLRKTIDELVRLDRQRRAGGANSQQIPTILAGPDAVETLLATLSAEDFIYVKALMHYGRGDDFGHDAPFSKYLEWTTTNLNDGSVAYLAGKNLSEELPAGLKKLGL
ncbi:hypothetical protein LMG19282_01508 [Cupriavidus campinensis]|uniref:DUF3775 domain-containing protein n=1 Tax=Cupriavidus campinensis TaxID=151783 RepID=A0ABY3EJ44_9BURK|nr:DUF3775 domain-containing protein [Cupriavidus campinensis]TSP10963.1 DUF3775 domain-containing protein [Cupriavidus campinensis]CAG2138516.1 hypothetical protein LMG19282_01508 [Cupriavidus campinensis]